MTLLQGLHITYLGYTRGQRPAPPDELQLNQPGLASAGTTTAENVVLDRADARIACRFPARDAGLDRSPGVQTPTPFHAHLDGTPPGITDGVDEDGNGMLDNGRTDQLVRKHDAIHDRTLEITFDERGAEAYASISG